MVKIEIDVRSDDERKTANDARIAAEAKAWQASRPMWMSKAARRQERMQLSGNRQGFHS